MRGLKDESQFRDIIWIKVKIQMETYVLLIIRNIRVLSQI